MALKINKQSWNQLKANSNNGMNLTKSNTGYNQNANQQIPESAF